MYKRKVIKVNEAVEIANRMLATSTVSQDGRQGIISLLEAILHDTNTYSGFHYLSQAEVPHGSKPGIRDYEDALEDLDSTTDFSISDLQTQRFKGTDPTRVVYIKPHKN